MTRWVAFALAWIALLLSFVDRLAWSGVSSSVSAAKGVPLSALGIFASAFFAGYVVSNLIGGIVVDRLGPRLALGWALIALGVFTLGFSLTAGIAAGVVLQVLMGLAAGGDYSACIKLVTTWFPPTGRAKGIGLLMTSLPVAVMIANSAIPAMLGHVAWPVVYQALGAVTIVFGAFVLTFLRETPAGTLSPRLGMSDVLAVLREGELGRLALVGFGGSWGTWGFTFWATALMAKGHGLSASQAGFATSLFGAAAIAAKPLMGAVSDAMGGRRKGPIVALLALFAVALLAFGRLETPFQFQIAAIALGFLGFSWAPLLSTLIAEIGTGSAAGTATGAANAIQQMGGVFAPLVIGAVFARTNSFTAAFVAMAIGPVVATAIMAFFCRDAAYARR